MSFVRPGASKQLEDKKYILGSFGASMEVLALFNFAYSK